MRLKSVVTYNILTLNLKKSIFTPLHCVVNTIELRLNNIKLDCKHFYYSARLRFLHCIGISNVSSGFNDRKQVSKNLITLLFK